MACLEKLQPMEVEREEGEIVDDVDDLSDISSEEEFLLRQRLQVLENYNNVLERKQAKRSVTVTKPVLCNKAKNEVPEIQDLSDVSLSNFDEVFHSHNKPLKARNTTQYKHRKRKEVINQENIYNNLHRAKRRPKLKKKIEPKIVISESSEESDQEDKNKRMKLATAISVKKNRTDSSLRSRLMNMLCGNKVNSNLKIPQSLENNIKDASKELLIQETEKVINATKAMKEKQNVNGERKRVKKSDSVIVIDDSIDAYRTIDLSKDDAKDCHISESVTDFNNMDLAKKSPSHNGSDDDLEMLRNFALQTKMQKAQEPKAVQDKKESEFQKPPENVLDASVDMDNTKKVLDASVNIDNTESIKEKRKEAESSTKTEDEDSDTTELRLICLRSTLLKKAIELKQRKKLRKRLSQSTSLYDDIIAADLEKASNEKENNTDTESVDMDMGSDHEKEKGQDPSKNIIEENANCEEKAKEIVSKLDDLEEDEDLLRAKLLTSLSKNLPLLVDVNSLNESIEEIETNEKANIAAEVEEKNAPQERRFIINTADSDSEGEHEATKNLTKMHMKLSDSVDFQQKLDSFLKSARSEVENNHNPDNVQSINTPTDATPKTPDKFVPKVVNHLPKTEQIEYKNLVKRMAELEKMRQARQVSFNAKTKVNFPGTFNKDTLKQQNVSLDPSQTVPVFNNLYSNVEEQIALSRKKIAEESAKVLKLKEEGFNLSQKYKIVATELKNLATAITFNKKNQKTAQIKLSKIRAQHQILLRRSTTYSKSNATSNIATKPVDRIPPIKVQKENAPIKSNDMDKMLKSVKVGVVNDLQKPVDLSVQVDVSSNKKTVIVPSHTTPVKTITVSKEDVNMRMIDTDTGQPNKSSKGIEMEVSRAGSDDYESPLQAFQTANWDEDPNGVLCPFVVDGSCKDDNCKYLHPKSFPHL